MAFNNVQKKVVLMQVSPSVTLLPRFDPRWQILARAHAPVDRRVEKMEENGKGDGRGLVYATTQNLPL